jgi:hypothetical protein
MVRRNGANLSFGNDRRHQQMISLNTGMSECRYQTKRNTTNELVIMLNKAKALEGYKLDSLDGEIGKVKEFYFDDRHWTVRYLVAETGTWLTDRQVLISPYALMAVNAEDHNIAVDLTKKQIEDSPSLDFDMPVSRQFEQAYYRHYDYPTYWGGPYSWGAFPYFIRDREARDHGERKIPTPAVKSWDPHLRSTFAVTGHHLQALDGELGHVEDFIIDDETWAIRYLIVDTHNWWPGRKVLVAPQWIERVSWGERKVFVNLDRETIRQSPEYTRESLITRDYEIELHGHYNRKGYWVDELVNS